MSTENESDATLDKNFRWGDYTISPSDVPEVSLFALAQRGLTHVLGNEVASALTAWRKTDEGKAADDAAIAEWTKQRRDAKIAQIMEGKLGSRVSSGPRMSGLDAIIRRVAVEWLTARFARQGKKLPTGEKTVKVGPAGREKEMTREQLVEQAVAKADTLSYSEGVTIREEAEKRHAADQGAVDVADELFS